MQTTFSSRAFNQHSSRAKKAAENGPVFITDRGKPSHVLLTIAAYQSPALLSDWLRNSVMREFEGRILPFDTPAALRCAALHVPDPKSERDALIAGTALALGLVVVTRNIDDFADCGVGIENPWLPAS